MTQPNPVSTSTTYVNPTTGTVVPPEPLSPPIPTPSPFPDPEPSPGPEPSPAPAPERLEPTT